MIEPRMCSIVFVALVVAAFGCACPSPNGNSEADCRPMSDSEWEAVKYISTMNEVKLLATDTKRVGIDDLADEALSALLDLPNLEAIALKSSTAEREMTSSHALTDAGVEILTRSRSIRHVLIAYGSITDESLKTLAAMKGLCELRLLYCVHLTQGAIDQFRSARPEVLLEVLSPPEPD